MDSIASFLQILNKPVHFLFIGIAVVIFAPAEMKWAGYVLLAGAAASAVEFVHGIIKDKRKAASDKTAKEQKKVEKEKIALSLYDGLHPREKYMVDSCIARNEWVYEGYDSEKYVTALVMKGFGQSQDFGRAIAFSGDSFITVRRIKGEEIKAAWAKESEEDEDAA